MSGDNLDLSSPPPASRPPAAARPFIGVMFDCCSVYQRIYLNGVGDAYAGKCPRCGGEVRFNLGPGGTSARMFRAS